MKSVHIIEAPTIGVRLCRFDDLSPGVGRKFVIRDQEIAVFRKRDGSLRAVAHRCPHRGGPLAEGVLASNRVICPLHYRGFNVDSGVCDRTADCAIRTYPIRLDRAGWVCLDVPAQFQGACSLPAASTDHPIADRVHAW